MNQLSFESSAVELGEHQFLTAISQVVQANYELAKTYAGLHASGFADWYKSLKATLEAGERPIIEGLGPQIEDIELRDTFYMLWEHLQSLAEVNQQIVAWLAEFADLATIQDKRDRAKLDRRLHKIAAEGSEGPVGPIWATRPEYQALGEKSRQTMAAIAQVKQRFDQRLEQLLSEASGEMTAVEPEQLLETDDEAVKGVNEQLLRSLPREMQRLVVTSKLEEDSAYLQMEVVTYVDLWERAEVVVDFIERVWRTFEPFQVKLEATMWSRRAHRCSEPRTFGLKPTYKKWAETRRLLLQGEISCIFMLDWKSTHSHCLRFDSDVYLGVEFGSPWSQARGHRMLKDSLFDPRAAKMLKLCINAQVWEGTVSAEVQEQIVSLACDLFQAVDGACGYVDVGNDRADLYHLTPYERRLGMNGPNTRRLWRDVRGAFWGNLLSARHIRALGGSQLVKQQAPCHKVVSLASQGEHTTSDVPLYLQMTQTLETATLEGYARLESFLASILISSQGQLGITVLHPALIASLGDATHLKQALADSVRRTVLLPCGALLVEYDKPGGWPMAYNALMQIGCGDVEGYRDIPQLRSMWWPDDACVWTLKNLITSRPKSGPIFPAILVQPCIPGSALEFQISFADSPTSDVEKQLRELVQDWSTLEYEAEDKTPVISYCSVLERKDDSVVWQADLTPVGQDAYIQLVMMLDGFSETTARLFEVHIGAWTK